MFTPVTLSYHVQQRPVIANMIKPASVGGRGVAADWLRGLL